jgi:hypothetical protein
MSMVKVSVAGCVACVPCARSMSMRRASRVCVVKKVSDHGLWWCEVSDGEL